MLVFSTSTPRIPGDAGHAASFSYPIRYEVIKGGFAELLDYNDAIKDGVYYIGGLTNWDERDIDIPLDFLSEGTWKARIYKDGVNADVTATDHVIENINVDSSTSLELHMAPGGGFAIIIEK